jgi:polyisoprenoid-binding protein YceI
VPSDGTFKKFTAKVRFDPANLAGSSVDVTIDTASAHTGNKDMDDTLESENFFQAKKFPTAKFVAASFTAKGGNKFEAVAKLTIRGITQDVVLPFTLDVTEDGGQLVAKVAGKVDVSRTKFGVGRGEWSNTKVIADKVEIEIGVVARRKK